MSQTVTEFLEPKIALEVVPKLRPIFFYTDFHDFFTTLMKNRPRGEARRLSKSLRVDPAFLSQVLRGIRNLSQDHAFAAAAYFKFSAAETEYFIELNRISHAGSENFKQHLLAKLSGLRNITGSELIRE